MAKRKNNTILLEGVDLIFKNFSGREGQYNAAGNRNFSIILDWNTAQELHDLGLNVRWPKERDEDEGLKPTLKVLVKFNDWPPKIVSMTRGGHRVLNEDTVYMLDFCDIEEADVLIAVGRPGRWTRSDGADGIPVYCRSLYAKLHENPLEIKYAHYQDSVNSGDILTCDGCKNIDGDCDDCIGRE